MKNRARNIKKQWLVLSEALSSFMRNNDLTAASSLAFSAMLALIPTLFLLTYLLSLAIGSSSQALARTQELLMRLLPAYSQDIVEEVRFLASHKGAVGLVNSVVLFWTMTPFVADMRFVLGTVFRQKPSRPFLLEKLFDVVVSMVFLVGLTAVMVAGIAFRCWKKRACCACCPEIWSQWSSSCWSPLLFSSPISYFLPGSRNGISLPGPWSRRSSGSPCGRPFISF